MVWFHQNQFLSLQNKPFSSKKTASPFCQELLTGANVEAIHVKVVNLQKKPPSDKYINWSFTKTWPYQGRFKESEENTHLSSNKLFEPFNCHASSQDTTHSGKSWVIPSGKRYCISVTCQIL